MSISGNMVGSYSQIGKTFIIQDIDGNEITGIVTESKVIFTAGDNDVREGMVYASDSGVSTGTKNIPAYRTTQGKCVIFAGEPFVIELDQYDKYDYTKFECMIAPYNGSIKNSVSVDKVVIDDNVYVVNSNNILSNIVKDSSSKSVNLNLEIDNDIDYVIHYFTYKEEV